MKSEMVIRDAEEEGRRALAWQADGCLSTRMLRVWQRVVGAVSVSGVVGAGLVSMAKLGLRPTQLKPDAAVANKLPMPGGSKGLLGRTLGGGGGDGGGVKRKSRLVELSNAAPDCGPGG